jgi:acyl carrier protein
LVLIFE